MPQAVISLHARGPDPQALGSVDNDGGLCPKPAYLQAPWIFGKRAFETDYCASLPGTAILAFKPRENPGECRIRAPLDLRRRNPLSLKQPSAKRTVDQQGTVSSCAAALTRSGPLKNGFRVNHITGQAEGVPRDAELFTPVVCRRDRQRDALARAAGCRDLHLRGHPIDRLGRSGNGCSQLADAVHRYDRRCGRRGAESQAIAGDAAFRHGRDRSTINSVSRSPMRFRLLTTQLSRLGSVGQWPEWG